MATTTVTQRIHNFSAGPAVLPMPVLEEAQRDLLMLPGVGMSVLEISHRSAAFDEIIEGAERDLRAREINVQETENIVFEGALAAVARINLDRGPDAALIDGLRADPNILDLQVVPLQHP